PAISLGLLAVFQLLSQRWAESANDAVVAGNRTAVYAGMLAVLILILRVRLAPAALLAGIALGALLGAGVEVVRLLGTSAADSFVAGRLNEPLGYYNAEAAALLVAFWPAVALAEAGRRPFVRGTALCAATLVLLVSLLAQSRGAMIALVMAAVVLLAAVP